MEFLISISLDVHLQKYELSYKELAFSICTLTVAPYALRHFELANFSSLNGLGHLAIAIIEFIPGVGGLVGLSETIASFAYNKLFTSAQINENENQLVISQPNNENNTPILTQIVDTNNLMLSYLPYKDLLNLSATSKEAYHLVNQKKPWSNVAKNELQYQVPIPEDQDPKE